jgi:hypothetical protein
MLERVLVILGVLILCNASLAIRFFLRRDTSFSISKAEFIIVNVALIILGALSVAAYG